MNIPTATREPPEPPAAPPRPARPEPPRPPRVGRPWWQHALAIVAIVGLAVVLAAGVGAFYSIDQLRQASQREILPGAVIDGVDLAGMTRQQALGALREQVGERLEDPITLRAGERIETTTPAELGAEPNLEEVVDEALQASREASWQTLASVRFLGGDVPFRRGVSLEYPEQDIRKFVRQAAGDLNREPVDAELQWTASDIEVTPGEPGHSIQVAPTVGRMRSALLDGETEIEAVSRELAPERTAADFDQVLLLRQSDFRLDYFVDGEKVGSYPVAIGQYRYPTPTGVYEVTLKRPNPVWVNPDPTGWGAGMPDRMGPGPNSPLGVRALNWSTPGAIRFHGTSNLAALGTRASHGCVRLSNADIIELYDMVDEGAVIVSAF